MVSRVLEPKFVPVEFEFDLERRHARASRAFLVGFSTTKPTQVEEADIVMKSTILLRCRELHGLH